MTTQKAQSKIKTSTIAITILSVLLAVAVASTIVLAAFSATKQISTNITFGGNLTLTITADSTSDFDVTPSGDSITITPVQVESAAKKFTSAVTIPAIKAKVNMNAYIGYQVSVSVTDRAGQPVGMPTYSNGVFTSGELDAYTKSKLTVTVTPTSPNFVAGTGNGVFNNTTKSAMTASDDAVAIIDSIVIAVDNSKYNAVAGYSVSVTIKFIAADAASEDGATTVSEYGYAS